MCHRGSPPVKLLTLSGGSTSLCHRVPSQPSVVPSMCQKRPIVAIENAIECAGKYVKVTVREPASGLMLALFEPTWFLENWLIRPQN